MPREPAPASDTKPRHKTTISAASETMRKVRHLALDGDVPLTRIIEAALELMLEEPELAQRVITRAQKLEAEQRSGPQ